MMRPLALGHARTLHALLRLGHAADCTEVADATTDHGDLDPTRAMDCLRALREARLVERHTQVKGPSLWTALPAAYMALRATAETWRFISTYDRRPATTREQEET